MSEYHQYYEYDKHDLVVQGAEFPRIPNDPDERRDFSRVLLRIRCWGCKQDWLAEVPVHKP